MRRSEDVGTVSAEARAQSRSSQAYCTGSHGALNATITAT